MTNATHHLFIIHTPTFLQADASELLENREEMFPRYFINKFHQQMNIESVSKGILSQEQISIFRFFYL